MMRITLIAFLAAIVSTLIGCGEQMPNTRAVYLLLDTSGTYTKELDKARRISNYLLATLNSGDSLAIARIDSGSFSEKDIVAKVTFNDRPSTANEQKRLFKQKLDEFVVSARSASHTDITGGVLQAVEYLNETNAAERYILIFSDLEEDLIKGQIRDFPIEMRGINVVALNVTKLRSDNIDPRDYMQRLAAWQQRVVEGGGAWKVVNDLERLERILQG